MQYFTFLLYTLLFITISVPVAIVIFKFFDIRFEVYGNYLFWLIALALFNALLPYQTKDIFYKGSLFQAYTNDDPMENAELDSLPSVISDNKSPLTVIDTVDKVNSKLSPTIGLPKLPNSRQIKAIVENTPNVPVGNKTKNITKSSSMLDGNTMKNFYPQMYDK